MEKDSRGQPPASTFLYTQMYIHPTIPHVTQIRSLCFLSFFLHPPPPQWRRNLPCAQLLQHLYEFLRAAPKALPVSTSWRGLERGAVRGFWGCTG